MFHKFGHVFSRRRLLRRFTPRNDISSTCHCERSEAIFFRTRFLTSPYSGNGVFRDSRQMPNPLKEDLDLILERTDGLWDEIRGGRIFITGGTGFFGCWLLESFAWANTKLKLNASAVVLSAASRPSEAQSTASRVGPRDHLSSRGNHIVRFSRWVVFTRHSRRRCSKCQFE